MSLIPEKLYKQIMENMPIPCVDLAIRRGNKFLLIKRKNKPVLGKWWMPGGRILKNESLIDAAKRKCVEECGVKPVNLTEIGTYVYMGKDAVFEDIKTGIHTISVVFEAELPLGEIKIDKNHSEFGWFEVSEFPSELKEIAKKVRLS
ncbi:ADP-ribose pyrophosphatase [uncultured archaeon]|nr:ADP-ribose pyrophosphatase [uncultured archaeon]